MMSRNLLVTYSLVAAISMIALTVRAMNVRGVFDNANLMADVWFQVTLVDAYLAFLAVWIFICRIEKSVIAKLLWLVAILCLGSMAIAAYMGKLSIGSWNRSSQAAEAVDRPVK